MTLVRNAASERAVLLDAVRALPAEAVHAATGKSKDYFYQLSHPNCRHRLQFRDAADLAGALEARGLLDPFGPWFRGRRERTRRRFHSRRPPTDREVTAIFARINAGIAEFNREMADVLEDGVIDAVESESLLRVLRQSATRIHAMMDALLDRRRQEAA